VGGKGGGGGRGGEMNQALYAHMNNKRKKKKGTYKSPVGQPLVIPQLWVLNLFSLPKEWSTVFFLLFPRGF
jgi:hypothetical protein